MSSHESDEVRVIPLRPAGASAPREPLWRHIVGEVLRRERLAQERTLQDVADQARISMPYLSELERGRKEASSEVLAAAARALGLGLVDLLALTQGELVRIASVRAGGRRTAVGRVAAAASATSVAPQHELGAGRDAAPGDGVAAMSVASAHSLQVQAGGSAVSPRSAFCLAA